jgi:UDP-N-acetylglucosamine acyltransferase
MGTSSGIHPTAIIDPQVQLADGVSVGAYSIIKGPVSIGAGSIIREHCVVEGATVVGRNCKIGPAAYVGMDPQHLRFIPDTSDPTYLVIGDNVTIRESARIHRSTKPGIEHATRLGENCFIMGAAHVGHDCVIEADVILADGVLLGGHCRIGQRTFMGGGCTIHQFVRIGRLCIIGGNEALTQDVPPFGAMRFGRLKGYNAIGCRRAGIDRQTLASIRGVYHRLRNIRTTSAALASIRAELPDSPEIQEIVQFIESSKRGTLSSHRTARDASRFDGVTAEILDA